MQIELIEVFFEIIATFSGVWFFYWLLFLYFFLPILVFLHILLKNVKEVVGSANYAINTYLQDNCYLYITFKAESSSP